VGGDAEGERGVVDHDVAGDEVLQAGDREVVDLVLAGRRDGDDLVPAHVGPAGLLRWIEGDIRPDAGRTPARNRSTGGHERPHGDAQARRGIDVDGVGGGRFDRECMDRPRRPSVALAHRVQRRHHAEPQQQVLHAPRQGVRPGDEGDLPLTAGTGVAIGLQQPVQEPQQLMARQAPDGRGHGHGGVVDAEQPVAAQHRQPVDVHRTAPLDGLVPPLLLRAP
jgi:hypothetical protein